MAEQESQTTTEQQPKKGRGRLIIMLVVMTAVAAGSAVAGIFAGPMLAQATGAGPEAPESAISAEPAESPDPPVEASVVFAPIVVDVRDLNEGIHHLKVGLAVEIPADLTEEEFGNYKPRGREAAITYLRSLTYEAATSPDKFRQIQKELSKRVTDAIGESRVKRVLVIDFVAQ